MSRGYLLETTPLCSSRRRGEDRAKMVFRYNGGGIYILVHNQNAIMPWLCRNPFPPPTQPPKDLSFHEILLVRDPGVIKSAWMTPQKFSI